MTWNLQLSNNSFGWKNVTFWGSKHTLTPPANFQGVRTPRPTPLSEWNKITGSVTCVARNATTVLLMPEHQSWISTVHLTRILSELQQFYRYITRRSADADKPARRVYRPVKVTKHGTIRYVRYGFLLVCYSNFVHKIKKCLTSKMTWPWKPG